MPDLPPHAVKHPGPQTDDCSSDCVDLRIHRDHRNARRGLHSGRRSPGPVVERGLRLDDESEVGELGSMFSNVYRCGSDLPEAMMSGRAAGANAVRLAPLQATQAA